MDLIKKKSVPEAEFARRVKEIRERVASGGGHVELAGRLGDLESRMGAIKSSVVSRGPRKGAVKEGDERLHQLEVSFQDLSKKMDGLRFDVDNLKMNPPKASSEGGALLAGIENEIKELENRLDMVFKSRGSGRTVEDVERMNSMLTEQRNLRLAVENLKHTVVCLCDIVESVFMKASSVSRFEEERKRLDELRPAEEKPRKRKFF